MGEVLRNDDIDYSVLGSWCEPYKACSTIQDQNRLLDAENKILMMELYKLIEHDAINEVKFEGFPDIYMSHDIELFNYRYRMCCIAEYMGKPTVCRLSITSNLKNIYGMPTRCLVTYPDMKTYQETTYTDATPDGVIPFYDTMVAGDARISRVMYWIKQYCDAQLTINSQIATHRTPLIMTGTDKKEIERQGRVAANLATGVKVWAMPENVVSAVKVLNLNAPWDVPDLVQYQAEVMRRIYACLGLDAPTWQKKERLIVDEQEANDETLSRVLQDMMESRMMSCKLANKKYGWNVTVGLANSPRIGNKEVNNESENRIFE